MLSLLHIENIAVIEQAEIAFRPGFNVLTGETGAGKSIVIDAISAVLGRRAYREAIRTGCDRAKVSAVFQQVPELNWFEESGIAWAQELLIQREIFADGRNVCRVNGQPVSVTMLRGLGDQLIQIHGQHDSARLFDEDSHLTMLDEFAGHTELVAAYTAAYLEMDGLRKQIRSLQMDEAEKLRRTENLRFQIQEIQRAELQPNEDAELEKKLKLMRSGERLMRALSQAAEALYGGEDTEGAAALTDQAARSLSQIAGTSDQVDETCRLVEDLSLRLQDAAERLRDLRDSFDFSPEALEEAESRADTIHRLKRKYGESCEAILDYMAQCQRELDAMETADESILRLKKVLREKIAAAKALAEQLSASRQTAAEEFGKRLALELRALDMPSVQFVCELTPKAHLDVTGGDDCRFLMSANVGEELRQMSRVASGGELARIMLAMKNVLSEKDRIPTMIFDEVDAGVSGRAAQKVAEKLRAVSAGRQVLCVTHLPQIAAMANTHFLISKAEQNGRTYTSVTPLELEGRKSELARLIGGARITENTLKSAEEMLNRE